MREARHSGHSRRTHHETRAVTGAAAIDLGVVGYARVQAAEEGVLMGFSRSDCSGTDGPPWIRGSFGPHFH
jgi:hypothetical protein